MVFFIVIMGETKNKTKEIQRKNHSYIDNQETFMYLWNMEEICQFNREQQSNAMIVLDWGE